MQINNRQFKRILLTLSSTLIKSPRWTLVGFTFVLIITLGFTTKLKSLYDLSDLVDKDFNTYNSLQLLNQEFDDKNQLQLVFTKPFWTEIELCQMRKIVTEFYLGRTDIKRLSSTFGLKTFTENADNVKTTDLIQLNCDAPTNQNKNSELLKIKDSPWDKILNSKTTFDLVVQMGLVDNDVNGRFGDFNPEVIDDIKSEFAKKMKAANIEAPLMLSGLVPFKYHLKKGYQILQAMNLLSLVICIFIFWFFYRSMKASFIFITSVTMTTVIVYGGMAVAGHSIDMLSNALPLMLTMSCLEDFIFLCHFRSHGYNFKKTFHKIILPSFLTSLTTAIGFGSLIFSELSIIRRFGTWAAVGSMVEWVILFLIFPVALILFPKLHFEIVEKKFSFFNFQISSNITKVFKWLAYAVIPLSVWASTQIHINDAPDKIFPKGHPIQNYIAWFKENKNWTADFSILSDQKNTDFQKKIDAVLSTNKDVIAFESPNLVQDYLVHNISKPFQDTLKKQWVESGFARRLISENNISRHIIYVKNASVESMNQINDFLNTNLCTTNDLKTCVTAGNAISYAEFGSRILKTLLDSLLVSLVLVSIVILIFRTVDLKTTFYLILSSIWGPLALIVFFGVFKIPVFYVTSICASLLVGLAGDNAIQFMYFSKKINKSVNFLESAALKITLGMMSLCLILFISPFTPLINLGGIFVLSFIFLYVGDVLILKAFTQGQK
jgi:uncharacterized protein